MDGELDPELETNLLPHAPKSTKGGLKTMPFIIANEAFEKVASYGLMPNMIFYLMQDYNLDAATGSSVLSIWSSLSNALAIFGAFVSDSYLGRFRVILIGSISSLLGMTFLCLTAIFPELRPIPCGEFNNCGPSTAMQLALLFFSFGLISIGAGCVRPCSIAFGADQFYNKENPHNDRVLDTFFNWYYASSSLSTILALTVIVYIQDQLGWGIGFAIPAVIMVCSTLAFLTGSSLYVKVKASESLFSGIFQVLVVSFKNRNVNLPPVSYEECYHHSNGTELVALTENLRFLNKACIIRDPERDLNPDGSPSTPWTICTVEHVESLKCLIRIIPLWSTGIAVFLCTSLSFFTLQAKTMNRHITKNFEFPAGSFNLLLIAVLTIWVAFYDRILVPLLAKYKQQPHGISPRVRIGMGIICSCMGMAVSAIVESIRREKAIEQGLVDDPNGIVNMSAAWLVPQFALFGLAEGLSSIGLIEFFYAAFPKSMSSIAVAAFTLIMALSALVSSILVNIVDDITGRGGNISWLSSNINKGHLDYFYYFLTFLNALNFFYFLFCCRVYGHS